MNKFLFTRGYSLKLAPGFLWLIVTVFGSVGCSQIPDDTSILARVGQHYIYVADLMYLEAKLEESGASDLVPQRRQNVQTLIDRKILLKEARIRDIENEAEVIKWLAWRKTKKLSEIMLKREVFERAAISREEVRGMYERGWDQQVVTRQIFVRTQALANQVYALLQQGAEFDEIGKEYSVDRLFGVPTGTVDEVVYAAYDGPENLVKIVFDLPVGGISTPTPLMEGLVIAQVTEHRQAAWEEVEEAIAKKLWQEKKKLLRGVYMKQLKDRFELIANTKGLDIVVETLQDDTPLVQLDPSQRQAQVYSFGSVQLNVEEVVEMLLKVKDNWQGATLPQVATQLRDNTLAARVIAEDAYQKGVDTTATFVDWSGRTRDNAIISHLREKVLVERVLVAEEDVRAYYEKNKNKFRMPAKASIQELLVKNAVQARSLRQQIDGGIDLGTFMNGTVGEYRAAKTIYDSQAPLFGEVWMNVVMNAPLGEIQGPVRNKAGEYSIFTVLERYPEEFYSLDNKKVRDRVEQAVKERKNIVSFNAYVEKLRDKYANETEIYTRHIEQLSESQLGNAEER